MAVVAEVDAANRNIIKKLYLKLWPRKSAYATKLMQNAEARGRKTLGGKTIEIPFEYRASDLNFKTYVGAGKFSTSSQDEVSYLTDTWVHCQDNTSMPEIDDLENQGEGQVVDRWMRRQERFLEKTQINIAKLVWGALTVNGFTGAVLGVNTIDKLFTTGTTVHGLAPADVKFYDFDAARSLWDPTEDTVTEAATEPIITNAQTAVSDGDPSWKPAAGYCGIPLWSYLRNMFRGRERFVDKAMLKAGFNDQFSIDGIPIFLDRYCPGTAAVANNHLYWIHDKIGISIMSNDDFIQVAHKSPMETRALVKQLFYSFQVWTEDRFHLYRFTKLNTAA